MKKILLLFIFIISLSPQSDLQAKKDSLLLIKMELLNQKNIIDDNISKVEKEIRNVETEIGKVIYADLLENGTSVITTQSAYFFVGEEPELDRSDQNKLISFNTGERIVVFPTTKPYMFGYCYRALYQGQLGWLYKSYFDEKLYSKLLKAVENDLVRYKNKKLDREIENERVKWNNIPNKFHYAIKNGRVMIGMKSEYVIESIGHPDDRNNHTYSWGTTSQWIFDTGRYKYIYFENGIVTSFSH